MRVWKSITAISLLLLLGGCASIGGCAGWEKFEPSRKDRLTDGTKERILAHNINGERRGCW